MGAVYRAIDRTTDDTVALKIVHGSASQQRFQREIRHLAQLDHPAIVKHLAHGTLADGVPWLAMEWLEAQDLGTQLTGGRLAIDDARAILRRGAEALAAAHRLGIVHRDVKPANLFLPRNDPRQVVLLDFGIARDARASLALTRHLALEAYALTPAVPCARPSRGSRASCARPAGCRSSRAEAGCSCALPVRVLHRPIGVRPPNYARRGFWPIEFEWGAEPAN